MRPSLRSDSDISVSFDWNSSLAGMQVGWIWVKQGLAKSAPFRWARQMAVALDALAFVDRKKTLPYPPVHSTTACPEWRVDRAGVDVAGDDADRRDRP